MIDLAAMTKALDLTRQGLEASGYALALDEQAGRLRLTVVAGTAACEDCLVPKSLFKQMALDEIRDAGLAPVEVDVLYPIDVRRA